MKGLNLLICAVLMVGCAQFQTLEELELAAIETGDWAAVEKRERSIARRQARMGPACSDGLVVICERRGAQDKCRCVSRRAMRNIFSNF